MWRREFIPQPARSSPPASKSHTCGLWIFHKGHHHCDSSILDPFSLFMSYLLTLSTPFEAYSPQANTLVCAHTHRITWCTHAFFFYTSNNRICVYLLINESSQMCIRFFWNTLVASWTRILFLEISCLINNIVSLLENLKSSISVVEHNNPRWCYNSVFFLVRIESWQFSSDSCVPQKFTNSNEL